MTEIIKARKGQWVEIHQVVLPAGRRAPQVPEETQGVPLEMRTKGFIDDDARAGDEVTVTTVTGRKLKGALLAVEPGCQHDFGGHVRELSTIGIELRALLQKAREEGIIDG
ncbi:MAG: 2-amino-4-oxopentanoate thiolase subunit OrtA [Bacillota bacterium]